MRTISVGRWRIRAPFYVFAVPYFLWYQFSVVLQYLRQNQLKLMESFGSCMERGFFIVHCLFARRTWISTGVKKIITNCQHSKCDINPRSVTPRDCTGCPSRSESGLQPAASFVPVLLYAHSPTFDGPRCLFPQCSDYDTGRFR